MSEKEEIYPKGIVKQSESFSDAQKFKTEVLESIKEIALETTEKAFEDKGYSKKEKEAGEYATGKKFGLGTELKHFNVRLTSRPNTNTFFEKIINFGGKEAISEISIGWDAENKSVEISYKTPEGSAFRGYNSKEGTHLINDRSNFVINSLADFKKELKKTFKSYSEKEVAQLTSTKIGIEDKTEKSINSMVEHMKKNKFTLSSLATSSFDDVSTKVGNYIKEAKAEKENKKEDKVKKNNPEVVAANSKDKFLFDDLNEIEEGPYKKYFEKKLKQYGVEKPKDLTKSQWKVINSGWESKEEKLDEMTTSGGGAVGAIGGANVDGENGTAGSFKYASNPLSKDSEVMTRKFEDTNYSKMQKKRVVTKSKNEGDSFWTKIDVTDFGYPKGMDTDYVSGQHSKNLKESNDLSLKKNEDSKLIKESLVKRKFLMKEEEGINKRYIVTEKRDSSEEKDRWKKLSLFETYETIKKAENINECSCEDNYEDEDTFVSMEDGQEENERNFFERNQDVEDGGFVDGREVIIIAKPKSVSNAMYKVYKDDYLNENKAYILDLTSGNLVNNPNFRI